MTRTLGLLRFEDWVTSFLCLGSNILHGVSHDGVQSAKVEQQKWRPDGSDHTSWLRAIVVVGEDAETNGGDLGQRTNKYKPEKPSEGVVLELYFLLYPIGMRVTWRRKLERTNTGSSHVVHRILREDEKICIWWDLVKRKVSSSHSFVEDY